MDRTRSLSATSLAVGSIDMNTLDHDQFRDKLRYILGLSKTSSNRSNKITSKSELSFIRNIESVYREQTIPNGNKWLL